MGPTSTNPPARPPTLCPLRALSLTHSLTHAPLHQRWTLVHCLLPLAYCPLPAPPFFAPPSTHTTTSSGVIPVQPTYVRTGQAPANPSPPCIFFSANLALLCLRPVTPTTLPPPSPTVFFLSISLSSSRNWPWLSANIAIPKVQFYRRITQLCNWLRAITRLLLLCVSELQTARPHSVSCRKPVEPPRLQAVSLVSRRPCRPHELHELHSTSVTVVLALKPGFETRWVGTGLLSVLTACPQACRNNCAVVSHCVARSYQPHTRNDHDQRREHEPVGPHEHAER